MPKFVSERNFLPRVPIPQYGRQRSSEKIAEIAEPLLEPVEPEIAAEALLDELPVSDYEQTIVEAVKENPVTIIVAETGAGKSTRVPQMLLKAGWGTTYLTQPRRAASRNVYHRIKSEVALTYGEEEADKLVSFQTAGEGEGDEDSRIKVVTDGLHLVRELHDKGIVEDDVLIIDEVHEWNANVEVLVSWTKRVLAAKPHLRVVIMSATMDANRLANYFADICPRVPPIIEVPGRTHEVEAREEPESTVIEETLKAAEIIHIENLRRAKAKEDKLAANGILVFMPGKREIADLIDELRRRLPPEIAKTATILPLHAKMPSEEQQEAFGQYPGIKIVVATEVAQTSLTIPDISYVVDSGYQRRIELDDDGVQGLVLHVISQADCDQRKGRTGRVGPGTYVLTRLDTHHKRKYVPYMQRDKYPTAEVLRTDIVRNTLRIAAVDLDINDLELYHRVSSSRIAEAKETLKTLGALDEDYLITPIGRRMNEFPVRAQLARMIVHSTRFSQETQTYVAAIAAAREVGGLQYYGHDVGSEWRALTEEANSDPLAQLDIFIATQNVPDKFLYDYDLDTHNVERAHELYGKIARKLSVYQDDLKPPKLEQREAIKECVFTGFIDSIYKYEGEQTYKHIGNGGVPREISNRSVVHGIHAAIVGDPYRVEVIRGGESVEKHIVEFVTPATLSELGRLATHLTSWRFDGFAMRGGKFVEVQRQYLGNADLGVVEEVVASPSPKLRETIIKHVMQQAGPQQKKLRSIKRELERLAHLAKDPVPQLTHEAIEVLVQRAAPEDITDPSVIDNNLRMIIENEGITLDSFVATERRQRIIENAPNELKLGDVLLKLSYSNSKPIAKGYRKSDVEKLDEEVFLPDGRQVFFATTKGRNSTLMELQAKLAGA